MKKVLYAICYAIGLILGVSLLIFNSEALNRNQTMLQYTLMVAGIIFIIPGIIQLIVSLRPKRDENGNILPKKWYTTVVAILALLWGIYILIFPLGFHDTLSITLGVSLILAGLAQMVWIIRTAESTTARFIIPVVTMVVGLVVVVFFNKADGGKSAQIGAILTGIMMVIWGINGFMSLRSKRVVAAAVHAAKIERKAEKDERKALKEQAKEETNDKEDSVKEESKNEGKVDREADSKENESSPMGNDSSEKNDEVKTESESVPEEK